MPSLSRLFAIVFLTFAVSSPRADAQCLPEWQPGPLNFGDIDGFVSAMWAWDPPGPDPLMLFVGGTFTHVGGLTVQHIAAWDGSSWRAVGDGLPGSVRCLTVHNNVLVAGGDFPGHVAFWNGNGWSYPNGAGGGISGDTSGGQVVSVYALAVYNGELIAGGAFDQAHGQDVLNVIRLDASNTWRPMGGISGAVNALQVFDADGAGSQPAILYAGSDLTQVGLKTLHQWSGATWTSSLSSPNGSVAALTVTNQGLIVGGIFTFIDLPGGGNLSAHNIARYDGSSWSAFGSGCGDSWPSERVTSLRAYGRDLIVAGKFNDANGVVVNNIARWNGSSFSAMGGGINSGTSSPVGEMRVFNNELIIGGTFTIEDGGGFLLGRNLVRWNGSFFQELPPQWPQVFAAAPFAGRIVFGGLFAHSDNVNPSSNVRNLMSWNGVGTSGFGSGVNASVRAIRALAPVGEVSNLAVAGDFTTAGGAAASRVARWSESPSNPLQTGWSPMSGGFNNSVYVLESGYQGALIAGGLFTSTTHNGVPLALGYMARWSGTQWLKFATANGSDMNGTVRAVKVYSVSQTNPLADVVTVAGGDFTTANGLTRLRIAEWRDNPNSGSTPWAAMGTGFNNTVFAIERHNIPGVGNNIYAAGAFTADGNNLVTFNRIARWSGTAWFAVGNGGVGGGFNGPVYALRSFGGYLYAAGAFTSVDGMAANRVARYGGSPAAWSEVAGGLDGAANVLATFQTEIMVGGVFNEAGFGSMETGPTARLLASGTPWILQQPASQAVGCPFGFPTMEVVVAPGYDDVTYQWRRNGVPLADGETGTGSYIQQATASELWISYADNDDAGSYTCLVSRPCGASVTSAAATLSAIPCCPPDTNDDGFVNVTDLLAVISGWGICSACVNCPADVNDDCQINVTDLLAVISAWGPCP